MIPKILHLYWGRNNPLSFLRYMTVVSFAQLNPDWKIKVHYPEDSHAGITWTSREHQVDMTECVDYFDRLSAIPHCEVCQIDLSNIEPMMHLAEVMRSDLARWHLLAEQGGWWSDFDILFIKPMSALLMEDSACVVGSYQQDRAGVKFGSIGFMGSDASQLASDFFKQVLRKAQTGCNPKKYQSAGQFAYTPVQDAWLGVDGLCMLPPSVVYPIQSWEAHQLYFDVNRTLGQFTIGIHWYGGFAPSQRFERFINENTIHKHHCFLASQLRLRVSA